MSYVVTIPVEFALPRQRVYDALCDLGKYPQWNSGMTHISFTGRMYAGLEYHTSTNVLGRTNRTTVKVVRLVPGKRIELASVAGLVAFHAAFELSEITSERCSVACNLKFTFSNAIFNLARPAVESITEARIRTDLETLHSLLVTSPY